MAIPRILSVVASSLALLPICLEAVSCPAGTAVTAFFAGEIDLGKGAEPCKPGMDACFMAAKIASGPDDTNTYTIDWDDGDTSVRQVDHKQVRHAATGENCDGKPAVKKA